MRVASVKAVPKAPIAVAKQMAPAEMKAGLRPGMMTSPSSTAKGSWPPKWFSGSRGAAGSLTANSIRAMIVRGDLTGHLRLTSASTTLPALGTLSVGNGGLASDGREAAFIVVMEGGNSFSAQALPH